MKKKVSVIILVLTILSLVVAVSSAAGPPGSGYWFGATHQNVGASNATIQVVAYDSQSTNTYTYSPSPLAPGASLNVGPSDIPGLPSGFIGSIVTSSDQPLVAQVNLTNRQAGGNGVAGGRAAAIYSGIGGSIASTTLNFPLAKNNHFNKTTTFYLQNAGTANTTVDVTFSFGGTDYPYTTPSIAPGQMVAVDPGLASVPSGNGNVGAMSLSSAEPIAGVMVEHETSASVGTVMQGSSGFAPSELGQTIYCPAVKKNFFGRTSGVQVQNAHTAPQDITIYYVDNNGVEKSTTANNVAAGASVTFINDSVIGNGNYSARVQGALGPVAAIVNESEIPLVNAYQTSTTYNCQSSTNATNTASYPAYKEVRFGRTTALQIQNVSTLTATVTLDFNSGGTVYSTNAQTIKAGASSVFVCVSSKSIWSSTALSSNSLAGVTINSDQPVVAIANEASWTSASPCSPNNGAGSFDKATSNAFNLP